MVAVSSQNVGSTVEKQIASAVSLVPVEATVLVLVAAVAWHQPSHVVAHQTATVVPVVIVDPSVTGRGDAVVVEVEVV